ncbi:MAG: hypothetical protein ACE5HS_17630 [bacterium]
MRIVLVLILFLMSSQLQADYLYKTTLLRAAPGKLLELIHLLKSSAEIYSTAGEEPPFIIRHSQGDHWDLLLLFPMNNYSDYYAAEKIANRKQVFDESEIDETAFKKKMAYCVAWQEEVFVYGPPLQEVKNAFQQANFFHVEMFLALAGKRAELLKQRKMENVYLKKLARPQNQIFTRDQGAAWDLFTIGFYRDLKHFAESADIPEAKENEAARAAGFESVDQIGPYLRTLIHRHQDTLAVAVK